MTGLQEVEEFREVEVKEANRLLKTGSWYPVKQPVKLARDDKETIVYVMARVSDCS